MKKLYLFMFVLLLLPFVNASLNNDIVGYFKLDETSGTNANNSILGGYNGTANNAIVFTSEKTGIINTAADFSAGTYWVDINNSIMPYNSNYTINMWVNHGSLSGDQGYIASFSFGFTSGFALQRYQNNLLFSNAIIGTYYNNWTPELNTWNMITVTGNDTGNYLYVNGALVNSTLGNSKITNAGNAFVPIGIRLWNINSRDFPLIGSIDELGIWNKALSDAEVLQLYNTHLGVQYPFDDYFTITAKDIYTNAIISNFTAQINGVNFSTVSGAIFTPYLLNTSFLANITIFADNYISDYYTNYVTNINLLSSMYPSNNLLLNFYDETTRLPINNVTYQIIGTTFGLSVNDTISNISNLPDDTYEIRYTKSGYTDRSYYFKIPLSSPNDINISMYLLNSSIAENFVLTVTDKVNQPIEEYIIASLLRRYVINNQTQYEVVEMMNPSYALGGSTPFTAVPNTVAYLFRIQRADGTVVFQGSGLTANNVETLYLIDQQLRIQINLEDSPFSILNDLTNTQTALTFNNISNTFFLSYENTNNELNLMCLNVLANNSDFGTSCSTSVDGIISIAVLNDSATTYTARAVATLTGNTNTILNVLIVDFSNANDTAKTLFKGLGLFFLMLTIIFIAVAYSSQPAFAVVIAALSIIAFSSQFLGLVAVPLLLQGTLLVMSIILAFMLRN